MTNKDSSTPSLNHISTGSKGGGVRKASTSKSTGGATTSGARMIGPKFGAATSGAGLNRKGFADAVEPPITARMSAAAVCLIYAIVPLVG
jgi:hypothetical protein